MVRKYRPIPSHWLLGYKVRCFSAYPTNESSTISSTLPDPITLYVVATDATNGLSINLAANYGNKNIPFGRPIQSTISQTMKGAFILTHAVRNGGTHQVSKSLGIRRRGKGRECRIWEPEGPLGDAVGFLFGPFCPSLPRLWLKLRWMSEVDGRRGSNKMMFEKSERTTRSVDEDEDDEDIMMSSILPRDFNHFPIVKFAK